MNTRAGPCPTGPGSGGCTSSSRRRRAAKSPNARNAGPHQLPALLPPLPAAGGHDRDGQGDRPGSLDRSTGCGSCPIPTNKPLQRRTLPRQALCHGGREMADVVDTIAQGPRGRPAGPRRDKVGRSLRAPERPPRQGAAWSTGCSTRGRTRRRPKS